MNNIKKYKTIKKGQRNVLYDLTNNEVMYLVQLSIYCNVPQYPVDLVGELGWVRTGAHYHREKPWVQEVISAGLQSNSFT
jgi:hypothetical protein